MMLLLPLLAEKSGLLYVTERLFSLRDFFFSFDWTYFSEKLVEPGLTDIHRLSNLSRMHLFDFMNSFWQTEWILKKNISKMIK